MKDRSRGPLLYGAAAALWLGLVLLVILGMSMRKIVNHDEHQFVAAGALIARQGLLPYIDFPYFHVPGLSYLYAGLFLLTDRLLLAARSVAVTASWLTLGMLFLVPVWLMERKADGRAWLEGALVVLLLASTQTFRYATGWAWNHDVPNLLLVCACWIQLRRLRVSGDERESGHAQDWSALGMGALLGMAVAMRASFALPALAFVPFLLPGLPSRWGWGEGRSRGENRRWQPLVWFAVGGVVGSFPAWIFLALAPARFLFGNFEYVRLNTAHYLEVGGLLPGQGWTQKWEMTRDSLFLVWRANLALILFTAIQLARLAPRLGWRRTPGVIFLLVLVPVALFSGYAPTPMQIQYIYLVFPLLALLNLVLLHYDPMPRLGTGLLVVAALYAAGQATQDFRASLLAAFEPESWVVNRVHAEGRQLGDLVQGETIITLAPIYPLEGGAMIEPALVSGPFGWRVANLLEVEQREDMGIVGPDEMMGQLITRPPVGILVGIHGAHAALEIPLAAYAQRNGYRPLPVMGFAPETGTFWVAPHVANPPPD